jgi:hypothetical protein
MAKLNLDDMSESRIAVLPDNLGHLRFSESRVAILR